MSVGPEGTGDMPVEEFREMAHGLTEWIGDFLASIDERPVLPRVRPGDVRDALPPLPVGGDSMASILEDFRSMILPAATHWNHPGFLAYFANTASGPGILGEFLAAALNQNAMLWRTSPAGTELEESVLSGLRGWLGLPGGFEGTINDTASHSSLYALAAARERAWPGVRDAGMSAFPPGRVYASAEAHSSIEKAVMTLGFGRSGYRAIPTGPDLAMDPVALEEAIAEDRAAGRDPIAVVATIGTTSTTSVDPVREIARIARREGLWLHVDAAYAGAAALVPEFQPHFAGWEEADSIVMNPHKWLFTPMDCSILYCRQPAVLEQAFSLTPEYLRTREERPVRNLMDSGIALGRRFRALKLWFVLRYFGLEGSRERIRAHVRLARVFAERVAAAEGWELERTPPFSTAVFRWRPGGVSPEEADALNLEILDRVNAAGRVFLSHTRVRDRVVLRLAVGNLRTTEAHVLDAWRLLREAAVRSEPALARTSS